MGLIIERKNIKIAMFKLIGKLFGGKNPVESIVGIVDKFNFSKEEKAEFEKEMQIFFHKAEVEMQKEVTERWKSDMNSDSWLSKNIRPMTLIFSLVSTILLIFIDSGSITFQVDESWVTLLKVVLTTVLFAYFGGRSAEKVKNGGKNKENN